MYGIGRTFCLYKYGPKTPISFFGNHHNGVPNGIVCASHLRESSYRGYFKNGKPNGKGRMDFFCGKSYLGEMKDGD
jgi:hypothetical protein